MENPGDIRFLPLFHHHQTTVTITIIVIITIDTGTITATKIYQLNYPKIRWLSDLIYFNIYSFFYYFKL